MGFSKLQHWCRVVIATNWSDTKSRYIWDQCRCSSGVLFEKELNAFSDPNGYQAIKNHRLWCNQASYLKSIASWICHSHVVSVIQVAHQTTWTSRVMVGLGLQGWINDVAWVIIHIRNADAASRTPVVKTTMLRIQQQELWFFKTFGPVPQQREYW